MDHAERLIEKVYNELDGSEDVETYHQRHDTASLCILTQCREEEAAATVASFASAIRGKRVVEVGAGVGLLALEMARIAASVVAIESDPAWSWVFTQALYRRKPPNLTWIFGTAESVADWVRADVAIICTRSGREEMRAVAKRMAKRVIFPLDAP